MRLAVRFDMKDTVGLDGKKKAHENNTRRD